MKRRKTSVKVPVITLVAIVTLGIGFFAFKVKNHKVNAVETREVQKQTTVKEDPAPATKQEPQATVTQPTPIVQSQTESTWPKVLNEDEAASLQVVVNKKHRLPSDYVPNLSSVAGGQMRPEAATALEDMFSHAQGDNIPLKIVSSYRSYTQQVNVYNGYAAQYGVEKADTFSARPGHSEHQTGLAVDVGASNGECELEICFENTSTGAWVKENAYKYGYIVRYPKDRDSETGYQYEPWHLRYVGTDIAIKLHDTGQTLDQYFNIEAGGY